MSQYDGGEDRVEDKYSYPGQAEHLNWNQRKSSDQVEAEFCEPEQIVLRLTARAILVADRDFRDPLCKRVGERGNESSFLIAIDHGIDDVPPVRAQHASVVMHRHADNHRGQPIVQSRRIAPIRLVVTLLAPSADHVV